MFQLCTLELYQSFETNLIFEFRRTKHGEAVEVSVVVFTYLLAKFITHDQNYYLKLDVSTSIRGIHQNKLVLSSSRS